MPDLTLEKSLARDGRKAVAGIDEVGRGPLAGPVVAAAVILPPGALPGGIDDSKRLRPAARFDLAARLTEIAWIGIGEASVEEISRLNILQASLLAMRRAVAALPLLPDHLLIDGRQVPQDLPCPATCVIGGDRRSLSIAAASIIAKTRRDGLMVDLAQQHPRYGWERNMGYGTPEHLLGLKRHGPTPHHRRTFRPVHNILCQDK